MKKAYEFERKALLSKDEFYALLSDLSACSSVNRYIQKNTYFDTPDLLFGRTKRTLRVREKAGAIALEYKYKQTVEGDMRKAVEVSFPLDSMPPYILSELLPDTEGGLVLCPLGTLETLRHDFFIDGALVSLDESRYFGYTDYEIEVETEGALPLPNVILDSGVDFSRPVVGKFHRFLARYAIKKA